MSDFNEIIGHESIIEHLQSAIKMNKVSHSYIFNGEDGIGKLMLAKAFVKTLQCEAGGTVPCGKCHSCIQAEAGSQPDIIYVTHAKAGSIGTDEVRKQVVDDIVIKPYSSRYKIYVIDDAQLLTAQARNVLLKTIEEPPAYGIIIFLTNNVESFLPTIISRCMVLNFKPVKTQLIIDYLIHKCDLDDDRALLCAAFAQGKPGRALKLAGSSDFDSIKSEIISLIKKVHDMDLTELVAAVKEIGEYDIDIEDCLDIITLWYRDVLLFKVSRDPNALIFRDEVKEISRAAERSSYEGLETIMQAFDKAKARLHANVNFDMTMELMLLTIKEN